MGTRKPAAVRLGRGSRTVCSPTSEKTLLPCISLRGHGHTLRENVNSLVAALDEKKQCVKFISTGGEDTTAVNSE